MLLDSPRQEEGVAPTNRLSRGLEQLRVWVCMPDYDLQGADSESGKEANTISTLRKQMLYPLQRKLPKKVDLPEHRR